MTILSVFLSGCLLAASLIILLTWAFEFGWRPDWRPKRTPADLIDRVNWDAPSSEQMRCVICNKMSNYGEIMDGRFVCLKCEQEGHTPPATPSFSSSAVCIDCGELADLAICGKCWEIRRFH